MSDSIREARRAIAGDERSEALVHLWNALEEAKSSESQGDLDDVESLAEKIADGGDEAEQAEAERLLVEFDRVRGVDAEDEVGTVTVGESETAEELGEAVEKQTRGSALWGLIGFAIFLFFLLRDMFF